MQPEDDGILLPTGAERSWLLADVRGVLGAIGWQRWVAAPLVEPSDRFFPDRWTAGERGVARVAKRLMLYADVTDIEPTVAIVDDDVAGGSSHHPVWVVVEPRLATFHVRRGLLDDRLGLVAALAREVARLVLIRAEPRWRNDERLVDVTTIVVGFGILTVEASLRHRSTSDGGLRGQRQQVRNGVCSPQAMSFLLAAQLVTRDVSAAERRRLLRHLQPNQAAFVRSAVAFLAGGERTVEQSLDLPVRTAWPAPVAIAPVVTAEVEDEPIRLPVETVAGANRGRPIFRVEQTMAVRLGRLLSVPVLLVGGLATGPLNVGLDIGSVIVAAFGLGVLGATVGRFVRNDHCSDPKCGAHLAAEATMCPKCGGTIRGTIGHVQQRLEAEEALARGSAQPRGVDTGADGSGRGRSRS